MKGNKHAPPVERGKEGWKWGGEERRQSQERKRTKRRGETYRKRKATWWICHAQILCLESAFYQNACAKRHAIAFLIIHHAEPLVTSYF